ncbi:hypothetical protein M9Y10_013265 [Tritrichomonas musculus]|uniref:BEACH domain-containing protein n=1 Tax=Tritrichomonas musculus TaxID=1915356 RepID=A0ABR2GKB3_9EUKA
MKKIKASFKKIVGLKFSNPKYKYWVQLFTKDYSKSSISIPPNYKFIVHSFYFDTIPANNIFTHSNEIESNPESSLPIYLKLDQKIKNQYFEFCESINNESDRKEKNNNTQNSDNLVPVPNYVQPPIKNFRSFMEIVIPHLIRFSIGFFYQFEHNLPFLINGDNPPDNSITFDQLHRFSVVHEMIIRCEIEEHISNYITYVLSPFFDLINPQLQSLFMKYNDKSDKNDEIRNFTLEIARPIVDFFIDMSANNHCQNFWSPCFIFIALISTLALPFIESGLRPLICGSLWSLSNIKCLPEAAKVASLAYSSQTLLYLSYSGIKDNQSDDTKSDSKNIETKSDNNNDNTKSDSKSIETKSDNKNCDIKSDNSNDNTKSENKNTETKSDNNNDNTKSENKNTETKSDNNNDNTKSENKNAETKSDNNNNDDSCLDAKNDNDASFSDVKSESNLSFGENSNNLSLSSSILTVSFDARTKITPGQASKILSNAETIGILAISAIENMSDMQSWNVRESFMSVNEKTIASSLLNYIETLFFSIMADNPPAIIDANQCVIDLSKGVINDDFSITQESLIRIDNGGKEWTQSVIPKKKYCEFPPSLLQMPGGRALRDICMHLKIISKNNEFFASIICENIFNEFKERKKDLRTLFFTFLTCKFLPPSLVSSVIVKRNSWNFLLNDRVLLPLAKYDYDLANLAEEVSVSCFSSSFDKQYSVIEAVSSLLYTSSISRALNIIEQMIISCPQKFVDEIGKGSFIDIIFRIESSVRQTILNFIPKGLTRFNTQKITRIEKQETEINNNDNDSFKYDDLLELRSRLFSIIKQISLLNTSQLVYPTERCSHLLSYFFELPLQTATSQIIIQALLSPGQEKFVIDCIVDFISATIQMILNADWRETVLKIISILLETTMKNKVVGESLADTSIILTLHKAARENNTEFAIKILSFICSMCSCNEAFLEGLLNHSAQWEFRTTWMNFFLSKSIINNDDINLLWKLTLLGDETVIRNTEGLWLLFSVVKSTDYFIDVVKKVTEICMYSIINRFQCSQADIILIVLDSFKGDNDERSDELLELIKVIGSSFFKPSELSEFFTKVQMKQSIKLIQILTDIIQATCSNTLIGIRSFFHIGYLPYLKEKAKAKSKFSISKTKIDFRPYVMFYVRFGKSSEIGNFSFLKINLNDDTFSLSVDLKDLHPVLRCGKSEIITKNKLESLKWMKFEVFVGKNEICISIDDKEFHQEKSIKIPTILTSISMSIEDVECDVESIAIVKENFKTASNFIINNQGLVALYSAHVLERGVCLNLFQGEEYNFPSALFNGISVPFTIHVINTISSNGGVRILLPLFEIMRTNNDLCLIRAVESIVEHYESMFIDQLFFRALSGILPDHFGIDFFKIFTEMYRKSKTSELRTEMLINIFCNWNLLEKLDTKDHSTYVQYCLSIVIATQPELFSNLFSVKSFFTQALLENENIWNLIDRFCIFQFTNDDFVSMLSAAVDNSVSSKFALNALKTILVAIDKHDKVIDLLKDFDYFEPFFPVFQNFEDEDIWIVVFQIFNVIAERKPDSMPSIRLLNCFSIINLSIITEKTLDCIISFIFSNDRTSKIQYIKNPQFLPFLSFILHCFSEEASKKVANMIYESIVVYDLSQKNLVKCSLWQFWILYLSNFDKTIEDWISLIAKIPSDSRESIEFYTELEALFFIYSEIADENFQQMMLHYLSVGMSKRPSIDLCVESFKYIFFNPKRNPSKFKFPPELLRDLKQLSKIINSILIDWSPSFVLSVRFDTRMNTTISTKWLDFDLASKCIDFLLANKLFVSKNVQFSDSSIPLSYLLTFAVHIFSISNFEFSCEVLQKVLTIPAIRSSKPLLCFLLLDFNGRDYKSQREIGKILCPSKEIGTNEDEVIKPPPGIEMVNLMEILSKESIKYQEYFDTIRAKIASKLVTMLEQTYNQDLLRKVILPKFDEILVENKDSLARISRRNHRIWTSIELELVKNGSIWSTISSEGLHWKVSPTVDGIGRRNQMKVNRHFDNHTDASQARDKEKVDVNLKTNSHNTKVFGRKFKLESILDEEENDENGEITHLKSATFKFDCTLITINANYKGTLYFMRGMISFESYETTDEFGQKKESRPKFVDVRFDDALYIFKRRFLHQQIGAEIFTNKRRGFFFIFGSKALRKKFISKMNLSGVKYIKKIDEFTNSWKSGKITNYEYLFWVNMLSGRSFNDIAQYPVFPWVLSDYSSETINLNDPSVYRDLTKTIGALNQTRLENLQMIHNDLKKDESLSIPLSLFRLHYSTPGYVIYFLIRKEPFTSLHIELQGGKFDHAMRLFSSIHDSFNSVISSNPDYRELIPEFFSTSEFLINADHFDLGKDVNDVVLPKWARNASQFIAMNRIALESSYVSLKLNKWIDLVFGCKQQDFESANLFHPYSDPYYFDSADKSKHEEIMLHAANFGVNPVRLFSHPHPRRTFIPTMPDFEEPQLMRFAILAKGMNSRPIIMWTRSIQQSPVINEQLIDSTTESSSDIRSQINLALNSLNSPSCEILAVISSGSLITAQITANNSYSFDDGSKMKKQHKDSELSFKTISRFKLKFQTTPCNLTFDFMSHFTSLFNSHGLFYSPSFSSSILTSTPSFSCDFNTKEINALASTSGPNNGGIIVVSSPWSSAFDVIDTTKGKVIFSSSEDSMPASITSVAADGCYVITGAQDASLCVWNIVKHRKIAQIHAHEHKIICVAYNDICDLIASVDSSGKFSFSSVRSASFTRSTILSEFQNSTKTEASNVISQSSSVQRLSGRVLTKIEISSLGFVVLFSEERNMTDVTTVLESFDFSQRRIEKCKIPGRVTSSCLCVFQDDSQFLLVAMSTLKVFLYNVTELTRRAAYGEVSCIVKCCAFSRERNELFLSLENGDLISYRFL